jgi:type IV secretory pathway TrbD component
MTLTDKAHRQQMVWGVVGVLAGIVGLLISHKLAFNSPHGKEVGFRHYELHFMTYNRLGAIVGIVLSVTGILAGVLRTSLLAWIASVGFAVVALQTLIQWRGGSGRNVLGSGGATLAFSIAMVLLYGITALLTSMASPRSDR